jgi:hypothetical protein
MAALLNPPRRIVKADAGVVVGAISSLEGQVRTDKTRIMTVQEIRTLQSKTEAEMRAMTLVELLDIGLLQETWECLRYEVANRLSRNCQLEAKPYPTAASPPTVTCWIGRHTKESTGNIVTRADQEYTFLGYTRIHLRRFATVNNASLDDYSRCPLIKRNYAGDVAGVVYYKSIHVTGHVLTCLLTRPADFIRQKIGKEGVVNLGDEWEVSHLCHNPCCLKPDHVILERHRLNMLRQGCLSTIALPCSCTQLHGTHNHSVCAMYHPDAATPCLLPAVYDVRLNPSFADNYKLKVKPRTSPRKHKKRKDSDQKSDDEDDSGRKDVSRFFPPDPPAKRPLLKPA